MTTILHLMGLTCAGKSTVIRRLVEIQPKTVHAVEVGKMLRAKYGEAHFKGQAAPVHTQKEAWDLYVSGVKAGIKARAGLVVVDGQPRDKEQAAATTGLWKAPHRAAYVLLDAEYEIRERRAREGRKPGPDLDLALARLTNDYRNCYVVMAEMLRRDQVIRVVDTGTHPYCDPSVLAEKFLAEYGS